MTQPLSVDIKFSGVLAKGSPRAATIAREEMIKGIEKVLVWLWRKTAEKTEVATGAYRGSIKPSQVQGVGLNLKGTVGSPSFYALPVEEGRPPGSMPNIDAIKKWMQIKLGKSDDSAAYLIARKIAVVGIPGKFTFENTLKEEESRIRQILNEAERNTAKRWENE